jgi:hypothetical protein
LFQGLKRLVRDLKLIDCKAFFVDGSFVTSKILPRDIDVCWDERDINEILVIEKMPILMEQFPRREQKKRYRCEIMPAYFIDIESGLFFLDYFQKDNDLDRGKGIVQINIS